jgi:hypothetical protein
MVYNSEDAVVAPAFAVNVFGFVGGVMSVGGGIGTGGSAVDIYPSILLLLEDTDTPTQPWDAVSVQGTANSPDGNWSVSNSIRADLPADQVFIATGTYGSASVVPIVTILGRGRYANSYAYWANAS